MTEFERQIRREAQNFARLMWESMSKDHPDEITSAWLMEKHPELTPEEAEEYRLFCKANTIVFKGCYGDGSIMWPRWVAFREEIAAL